MCKYILNFHLYLYMYRFSFCDFFFVLEMRVARKTAQPLTLKSGRRGPLQGEWSNRAFVPTRNSSHLFYNFRGGLKLPKFDVPPPQGEDQELETGRKA